MIGLKWRTEIMVALQETPYVNVNLAIISSQQISGRVSLTVTVIKDTDRRTMVCIYWLYTTYFIDCSHKNKTCIIV